MCLFRLSRRPDSKTRWHSGHMSFDFLPKTLLLCRRNKSFLIFAVNSARHPGSSHLETPLVEILMEADGEGAEAGLSMSETGGKLVAGSGELSNMILGTMFGKSFWLLPGGDKECPSSRCRWTGKAARLTVLFDGN